MNICNNKLKIYMIGICGIGMSAISKYLTAKGFNVSGSDLGDEKEASCLNKLGVKVYNYPNLEEVENSDIIVYSSAIKEDNLELSYAKKLCKAIYKRSQVLSEIINSFETSVGISGSHGKTTSVAMISHILHFAKKTFTTFIGGKDALFENMYTDNNRKLVVSEVCEFAKNINDITTAISVVTNIDNDHLDCYNSFSELKKTFFNYLSRAKIKIICRDDEWLKDYKGENVVTYGIENESYVMAKNLESDNEKYSYNLYINGKNKGKISLKVYGKYSVYNSLCAVAIAVTLGISYQDIISSLNSFSSVKRRFEFIGKYNGKTLICDYAHHPTELIKVIETANKTFCNPLFIFQPHTYKRTQLLFTEFIKVLENKKVCVYKTYGARDGYNYFSSSEYLASEVSAKYIENEKELKQLLDNCTENTIVFLGAGDIYNIAKSLIN